MIGVYVYVWSRPLLLTCLCHCVYGWIMYGLTSPSDNLLIVLRALTLNLIMEMLELEPTATHHHLLFPHYLFPQFFFAQLPFHCALWTHFLVIRFNLLELLTVRLCTAF